MSAVRVSKEARERAEQISHRMNNTVGSAFSIISEALRVDASTILRLAIDKGLQAETELQLIDELEVEEVRRTLEADQRKDVVREADRLIDLLGGEP